MAINFKPSVRRSCYSGICNQRDEMAYKKISYITNNKKKKKRIDDTKRAIMVTDSFIHSFILEFICEICLNILYSLFFFPGRQKELMLKWKTFDFSFIFVYIFYFQNKKTNQKRKKKKIGKKICVCGFSFIFLFIFLLFSRYNSSPFFVTEWQHLMRASGRIMFNWL